jgi:ABC-2 type transport system ATP-binding protein
MSDDVILAEGLTKSYGSTRGVVDLSFAVRAGEVFGFLGPNGAGKSTTIRTMLDLIRPTQGRITVFGSEPRLDASAIHARTGYVPGEFGLYERMHVHEYLEAFASFRRAGHERIEPLAEALRLDLSRPIHELPREQAEGRPGAGVHARARSHRPR